LYTVLVDYETFAGRICELDDGTVLSPGQLAGGLSQADIERVVFDGPDRVLAVSHRRRFTGALRRAIQVRDRQCQHPSGCDVPASGCDVDHIVPWPISQETSLDNGRLVCPTHNRDPEHNDPRRRRFHPRENSDDGLTNEIEPGTVVRGNGDPSGAGSDDEGARPPPGG
jgi:hypothetical protein